MSEKIPRGTVYVAEKDSIYHGNVILLEDGEIGKPCDAERFYNSTEAFGGLPGKEYISVKVKFYNDGQSITPDLKDSRKILESELETSLDKFTRMAVKAIVSGGREWANKKYWETEFWRIGICKISH